MFAQTHLNEGIVDMSMRAHVTPTPEEVEPIDPEMLADHRTNGYTIARIYKKREKGRLEIRTSPFKRGCYGKRWRKYRYDAHIPPSVKINNGRKYFLTIFGGAWGYVTGFEPVKYYNVKGDLVYSIECGNERLFCFILPEDDYSLFSNNGAYVVLSIRSGGEQYYYCPEETPEHILGMDGIYSVKEISGCKCIFCTKDLRDSK